MSNLKDLLRQVDEQRLIALRWREDFIRFIQDGTASKEFLNYLDSDKKCQQAVDMAFEIQAEAIQSLAQALEDAAHAH